MAIQSVKIQLIFDDGRIVDLMPDPDVLLTLSDMADAGQPVTGKGITDVEQAALELAAILRG
jgi:hypothetical protein